MNVADERTKSLWMDVAVAAVPALPETQRADVVVVGSGIAGLSAAYELASRGRSIIVLDRGAIGSGMTARTTAHLASALDDGYAQLTEIRGAECARLCYESTVAAIDRVEAIQREEAIACDFARVDGYSILAPGTSETEFNKELEACRRLGIPVIDCADRTPFHLGEACRSLRFPQQARFHPTKYLAGLASAIQRKRGRLFAHTCVDSIEQKHGEMVVNTTSGCAVLSQAVVVATNSPVNVKVAVHTKQAPFRTYVIAARIPRGTLNDALYWDTLDPYHYVRLQPFSEDEDVVIIGGEDHKSGEVDDGARRFEALEGWARARLPQMADCTHRWSGQVLEPVDFVGFIGESPEDEQVFLVSGDSGQGITNGVTAGMLIADMLTVGSSPWSEVYDSARKVSSNISNFISENITTFKNFT